MFRSCLDKQAGLWSLDRVVLVACRLSIILWSGVDSAARIIEELKKALYIKEAC